MPDSKTRQPAAKQETPSTQAGEYVREGMVHIREGKHGARWAKQAITIGLRRGSPQSSQSNCEWQITLAHHLHFLEGRLVIPGAWSKRLKTKIKEMP